MNNEKSDYWKGLLYFGYLMICFCMFFTIPDGDTVFYKLLGLFGISPGIRLSSSSTLYIYMLIPLIMAGLSVRKVMRYWWHYGLRFKEYNVLLRYLPVLICIFVFWIPTTVHSMFYTVISQRNGLQSVVYYADESNPLSYDFAEELITCSYDLTFENYGDETVEFQVKLANFGELGYADLPEIFIKENNSETKVFTLLPKQKINYAGEFTDDYKAEYSSGSGGYSLDSVVLANEKEQYRPRPIVKNKRDRILIKNSWNE